MQKPTSVPTLLPPLRRTVCSPMTSSNYSEALTSSRESGKFDVPLSHNELIAALSMSDEFAPGSDGLPYSAFKVSNRALSRLLCFQSLRALGPRSHYTTHFTTIGRVTKSFRWGADTLVCNRQIHTSVEVRLGDSASQQFVDSGVERRKVLSLRAAVPTLRGRPRSTLVVIASSRPPDPANVFRLCSTVQKKHMVFSSIPFNSTSWSRCGLPYFGRPTLALSRNHHRLDRDLRVKLATMASDLHGVRVALSSNDFLPAKENPIYSINLHSSAVRLWWLARWGHDLSSIGRPSRHRLGPSSCPSAMVWMVLSHMTSPLPRPLCKPGPPVRPLKEKDLGPFGRLSASNLGAEVLGIAPEVAPNVFARGADDVDMGDEVAQRDVSNS